MPLSFSNTKPVNSVGAVNDNNSVNDNAASVDMSAVDADEIASDASDAPQLNASKKKSGNSIVDKFHQVIAKFRHDAVGTNLTKEPISTRADLMTFKPNAKYVFHSDYFMIDDYYASILTYVHTPGANDAWPAFWGCNRFPSGLAADVSTVNFEQVQRMDESWINEHQARAENVAEKNQDAQSDATNKSKSQAAQAVADMQIVSQELLEGDAYLNVHNRILVKSATLEGLEEAIDKIEREYVERFSTMTMAAYEGDQAGEMGHLFSPNADKRGSGEYFTSSEFAGAYSLVSHGFEDKYGVYVGSMRGDINPAAVLFDIDGYNESVVVCSTQFDAKRGDGQVRVSDEWGSKISQMAMLGGHRVVHLMLDNVDLDKLGPKFERLTYKIDLSRGDVNMFEMFGPHERELDIFATQMHKLALMTEQLYHSDSSDTRALIQSNLIDALKAFYIDNHMWTENAPEHRDRLRIVGIPHTEVPRMSDFQAYLATAHKRAMNTNDTERQHTLNVLTSVYQSLLNTNGDLFNTITSDAIDGAASGLRVLYDFAGLAGRGPGIAMAQLVNILSYAVDSLSKGDVLIIHGAKYIDDGVREYVTTQLDRLHRAGARVVWLYDDYDAMFDDVDFNHFDRADYTIFGTMSAAQIDRYQEILHGALPEPMIKLMSLKSSLFTYVRRGLDNVTFDRELHLDGLYEKDKKDRASMRRWRSRNR